MVEASGLTGFHAMHSSWDAIWYKLSLLWRQTRRTLSSLRTFILIKNDYKYKKQEGKSEKKTFSVKQLEEKQAKLV